MKLTESRIRYLRAALSEAVRAGDREAAKRLTKKLVAMIGKTDEVVAQANAG